MHNHASMNRLELSELKLRFAVAVTAVGADASRGGAVFDDLVRRYREPHRHYHDLRHVDACLSWLDWFAGCAQRRAEVELALWFHDAIYVPGANDNEERSAALAHDALQSLAAPSEVVERITGYVQATRDHRAGDGDAALVVDLDLAILAADPCAYSRFEEAVRLEYAFVEEAEYRRGRAGVLQGFVDRERIYRTEAVAALLEQRARQNLQRTLQSLTTSPRCSLTR